MTFKQLKVATSTRDITRKVSQILSCLEGYPEGLSPQLIALKTRINVNTVKSLLPKIVGIEKVMRGLYKVVKGGDTPPSFPVELRDWNFHNLVLSAVSSSNIFREERFDFGLVSAVLYVSAVGKCEFRVSSDFPLNVSSICFVGGFFSYLVGVPLSGVMVSTVEFNKDFKNLRLDGVKSIALDNLVEQFKIYQEKLGLRVEHKTKVPMSVDSIVDMLSNNPNSVEFHVKLNAQKDVLDRLTRATDVTTKLLFKLLDKMCTNGELRK